MAIVALCLVIIVHEAGHYLAAIWSGMKVDRFSVFGIGPAIVRLGTWRGTEFVIGAIPFGAYVQIRGMEASGDPAPGEPSVNFSDKPLYQRAAVLAGGPVANYLAAAVLFFAAFAAFGVTQPPQSIVIERFEEGSSAHAAGLQLGDELVTVGETTIDPKLRSRDVIAAPEPYRGKAMPVTVRRDGALVEATLQVPAEGLALGVVTSVVAPRERVPLGAAVRESILAPIDTTTTQLQGLWMLITRQISGRISGPVDIVHQIARSARRGVADFIEMTALISTLLGMFNLLPLPALDGGRLAFLGYEALARRRANPQVEEMVHGYGMLALLALLLFVTVGDVRRLF